MTQFPDQVRPILVSIVSHGHGTCVATLLKDLASEGNAEWVRVILTLNVAEDLDWLPTDLPYPLRILKNPHPRGFATNHNAAFRFGMTEQAAPIFSVLNPDIRLQPGTMAALVMCFDEMPTPALVAPAVRNTGGRLEDSARPLPTPFSILRRGIAGLIGVADVNVATIRDWDWLAGMFMMFDAQSFRSVGGFDEGYFLYYEDVDICCRLRLAEGHLRYCQEVTVVHDARRDSHHRFGYFLRHLGSATRFFLSPTYRHCRRLSRSHAGDASGA